MKTTKLPGDRLDAEAAAAWLGRSRSWLDKERYEGRGPRFVRMGQRIFYRVPDLQAYVDSRVVETQDSRSEAA